MLDSIAELAVIACPAAISCATVVAAERLRTRRRRELLNRSLHELRRPLQALALVARSGPRPHGDQLGLALEALDDLDRAINGAPPRVRSERVDVQTLAEQAVARWRTPALLAGRRLELAWRAGAIRVACDPGALGRALDNLIANSLEHGSGLVRIEGIVRTGRLRLVVADGSDAGTPGSDAVFSGPATASRPRAGRIVGGARDRRRGHGLRVVAAIAAEHGGRFATCRHETGASAVIELPLGESRLRDTG